jgi:segregation and condensation protein B
VRLTRSPLLSTKKAGGWPAYGKPQRRPYHLGRSRQKKGDSRRGGSQDARLARLEAVLFVAREPLNSRKLAQFSGLVDGTEARTLVRVLNERYDAEGCAFRAEEVAGGFQLMTRPQFGPWIRRLVRVPVETRLSAPALETLSVVAYRQPVLRADVDSVRGVDCGEILRQLMERDLVRIVGRSDDLGRPYLYGTTKRFLQIFGLRHLEELPRADILRAPQVPAELSPEEPAPQGDEQHILENRPIESVEQA